MNTKKLVTACMFCSLLLVSVAAMARDDRFNGVYEQYKNKENIVSLSFSRGLLSSMLQDDKDAKQFLDKINEVKLLVCDGDISKTGTLRSDLSKCFNTPDYKDLMTVNDGGDKVTFKSVTDHDKMTGLVMMVTDATSLVVIYINGNITIDNARQLAAHLTGKSGAAHGKG